MTNSSIFFRRPFINIRVSRWTASILRLEILLLVCLHAIHAFCLQFTFLNLASASFKKLWHAADLKFALTLKETKDWLKTGQTQRALWASCSNEIAPIMHAVRQAKCENYMNKRIPYKLVVHHLRFLGSSLRAEAALCFRYISFLLAVKEIEWLKKFQCPTIGSIWTSSSPCFGAFKYPNLCCVATHRNSILFRRRVFISKWPEYILKILDEKHRDRNAV